MNNGEETPADTFAGQGEYLQFNWGHINVKMAPSGVSKIEA
jgi:hypothetical protein